MSTQPSCEVMYDIALALQDLNSNQTFACQKMSLNSHDVCQFQNKVGQKFEGLMIEANYYAVSKRDKVSWGGGGITVFNTLHS